MVLLYILLFVTVFASGSLVFVVRSDDSRVVKLMLSFSGAFLIGISFLKLIPEVFSTQARYVGLFVLLGFLIQLALEMITEGAEHGHDHVHSDNERVSPFLLLIGLCIHSFLEGMPIVGDFCNGNPAFTGTRDHHSQHPDLTDTNEPLPSLWLFKEEGIHLPGDLCPDDTGRLTCQ